MGYYIFICNTVKSNLLLRFSRLHVVSINSKNGTFILQKNTPAKNKFKFKSIFFILFLFVKIFFNVSLYIQNPLADIDFFLKDKYLFPSM